MDGRRAGRLARPDRPAGRRFRLCAGIDLEYRKAATWRCRCPTVPQGRNSIADFIPVARIADMLLHPGEPFDYNGQRLTYPDIKLVYWAGGNPFHHHQDLNRLRRAFARPDTVIVTNSAWTATARHADIVLPATITLGARGYRGFGRRSAVGGDAPGGQPLWPRRVTTTISLPDWRERLGFARSVHRRPLGPASGSHTSIEPTRRALLVARCRCARFREFWELGELVLPTLPWDGGILRDFRRNPDSSAIADAERQDRDHLGNDRRFRLSGLPRPSGLAAARPKAPARPRRHASRST